MNADLKGIDKSRIETFKTGRPHDPSVIVIHPTYHCSAGCPYCYMRESWAMHGHKLELVSHREWLERMRELHEFDLDLLILAGGGEPTDFELFDELCELIEELDVPAKIFSNGFGRNASSIVRYGYLFESISFNLRAIIIRKRFIDVAKLIKRTRAMGKCPRFNAILVEPNLAQIDAVLTPEVIGFLSHVDNLIISPEWRSDIESFDVEGIRSLCKQRGVPSVRIMEDDLPPAHLPDGRIYCGSRYLNVTIGRDLKLYPCCQYSYQPAWQMADLNRPISLKEQWNNLLSNGSLPSPSGCSSCFFSSLNRELLKIDAFSETR